MKNEHRTFGQKLAVLRNRALLTQEALAEKASLSRNYIGLLESGRRKPSLETVLRIQDALQVEWEELIPNQTTFTESDAILAPRMFEPMVRALKRCTQEEVLLIQKLIKEALILKRLRKSYGVSRNSIY